MSRVLLRRVALAAGVVGVLGLGPTLYMKAQPGEFPPDTTPEGAYLRIAVAVRDDHLEGAFAYLETASQWACFTTRDYRKKGYDLVAASYPEPERSRLLGQYRLAAESIDAADYFAREARARGWLARLRRDLSGIARTEVQGERATIETVRKTRYAFRRRENGIWGLTLFTAELTAEAQLAARDESVVEKAAADYRSAEAPR